MCALGIGLIIGLVIVFSILAFLSWCIFNDNPDPKAKISFKLFLEMYSINKNKWRFDNDELLYDWEYHICFSFIDYIKYLFFLHNKNKKKKKINNSHNLEKLLQSFQKDIDKFKKEI